VAEGLDAIAPAYVEATPSVTIEHAENRCPRLVNLTIGAEAQHASFSLMLDIEFGEHTSGMTGGTVRYSLKRADLCFDLKNCQLPVGDRTVNSPMPDRIDVKRAHSEGRGLKGEEEQAGSVGIKLNPETFGFEAKQNEKSSSKQEFGTRTESKFGTTHFTVTSAGGPSFPIWTFTTIPGNHVLLGSNQERFWSIITVDKRPAVLDAHVRVAPDDIICQGVGGLWPSDMSPRKNRVARYIALGQLNFHDFLSRVQLVYS
jgi:hypothetical protein